MASVPVIETRDLTKEYDGTVGLVGLDLEIEAGEIFGFLGPNGAGKSTTIRILLDLIRATRGEARMFGCPTSDPTIRERVGYLPGELALDERLTGHKTLAFLASLSAGDPPAEDLRRRRTLCERLGLAERDLARRVREYSRGMKQKLGFVAALQHDPDLLVLDEPTTGLDPLVRESVLEILVEAGREGKTVFHSSHVLSEVERTCTRVGIVGGGRLLKLMRPDDVRRTSVRRMEIGFADPPPLAELALPGIEIVEHSGNVVVLSVGGRLDPLLQVLSRHSVLQLTFPEPSLEEAFVEFYRTNGGNRS